MGDLKVSSSSVSIPPRIEEFKEAESWKIHLLYGADVAQPLPAIPAMHHTSLSAPPLPDKTKSMKSADWEREKENERCTGKTYCVKEDIGEIAKERRPLISGENSRQGEKENEGRILRSGKMDKDAERLGPVDDADNPHAWNWDEILGKMQERPRFWTGTGGWV